MSGLCLIFSCWLQKPATRSNTIHKQHTEQHNEKSLSKTLCIIIYAKKCCDVHISLRQCAVSSILFQVYIIIIMVRLGMSQHTRCTSCSLHSGVLVRSFATREKKKTARFGINNFLHFFLLIFSCSMLFCCDVNAIQANVQQQNKQKSNCCTRPYRHWMMIHGITVNQAAKRNVGDRRKIIARKRNVFQHEYREIPPEALRLRANRRDGREKKNVTTQTYPKQQR